ncbi:hypothetical protein KDJ56_02170 [Brevibacillus composti]|uniref:Uncharacterized protein n=1 Tax=Brevibacillus composti TaxID=2796470 RepID=A0A7T5ELG9_9BACL|nr:hypothetical protein [Brevibacillus composti]QQE74812.1 hypothetical protein JD108_02170 [Brevibacillus composti]QUO41896.1 hypothetical protein KDJ56_02170 [Brevibacillus composti]
MTPNLQKRAVVIWENRTQPNGPQERSAQENSADRERNLIPFPGKQADAAVQREATATTWTVGPRENPAVISIVSSGFDAGEQTAKAASAPRAMLGVKHAA